MEVRPRSAQPDAFIPAEDDGTKTQDRAWAD